MCGIGAIISKTGRVDQNLDQSLGLDLIEHRGPDDKGTFQAGSCLIGSRRLAILDLSPAGHMPMRLKGTGLWCVHNGEVYNFKEIREELRHLGQEFDSNSDTEVILAAYARWGTDCLRRFNGMFAFLIYDEQRQVLLGARDRFGIKPFHYLDRSDRFVVGSEIRQILPHMAQRVVSGELLQTFLLCGLTDYSDQTWFEGVQKLPSGHFVLYDLRANTFRVERWYEPATLDLGGVSENALVEEFARRFDRSIELRLRSDVRVGTCLSGGLDSSLIAAIASRRHAESGARDRFCAVTAISTQKRFDESAYARAVMDHCGLEWVTTRPDHQDFRGFLDRVIVTQEEPFPTTSMIFQYFVMKAAREAGITVLLDGQGGDELLLGYPIYRGAHLNWLRRSRGIAALCEELWSGRGSHEVKWISLLKYMVGLRSPALRLKWYRDQHDYFIDPPAMPRIMLEQNEASQNLGRLQRLEVFRTVLPGLLRYEDRSSMAWSIETRLPFLDFNVVEFCLSLPHDMKIHRGWSKYLLRRAAEPSLPREVVWRRSKFGFESPENDWLDPLMARMKPEVLACPVLGQLVDPERLSQTFDRLDLRGRWRIFVVARWASLFGVKGVAL